MNLYPDAGEIATACKRVVELKQLNLQPQQERRRVRAIMNGGAEALAALLGDKIQGDSLPVANLMVSADTRLAQKLGRRPDIKVDPPISNDSDPARKGAEKRARIVESMDDVTKLHMMLPQAARWLPGYGFVPFIIRQGKSVFGDPYPVLEMRDPYFAYPGSWGAGQQPRDIAFCYMISTEDLIARYPHHAAAITRDGGFHVGTTGANSRGWGNTNGAGHEIYEYFNAKGSWWVLPSAGLLLEFTPNILSRPNFYVAKRFAFDRLVGQYDHVIGLMAAMARLNLLLIIATEDAVMAETTIVGSLDGENYKRGRNAVNYLTPGSSIEKMNSRVPFEAFQYMNVLEKQLRTVAGYSGMDDGTSPNSFVTGQGLAELKSDVGLEIREYFTVISDALVELDSRRLEWFEEFYPGREINMAGVRAGSPFEETFVPARHIKGNYRTRRVYGAMAGFDDTTKILTGLQLVAAGAMDIATLMENIDGLENHTKILERVREKQDRDVLTAALAARAEQGDERVLLAMVEGLPDGEEKDRFRQFFAPAEEEAPDPMAAMAGGSVPDVATIMGRLTSGGGGVSPTLSAQQVSPVISHMLEREPIGFKPGRWK